VVKDQQTKLKRSARKKSSQAKARHAGGSSRRLIEQATNPIAESDDLMTETQAFSSELIDGDSIAVSNFNDEIKHITMTKNVMGNRRISQDTTSSKAWVIRTDRTKRKKASEDSSSLLKSPNFGTILISTP